MLTGPAQACCPPPTPSCRRGVVPRDDAKLCPGMVSHPRRCCLREMQTCSSSGRAQCWFQPDPARPYIWQACRTPQTNGGGVPCTLHLRVWSEGLWLSHDLSPAELDAYRALDQDSAYCCCGHAHSGPSPACTSHAKGPVKDLLFQGLAGTCSNPHCGLLQGAAVVLSL